MKLYAATIPLLVLLAFLYSGNVAQRASEHGNIKITKDAIVAEVKADLAKFKPSDKFVYNGNK